MINFSSLLQEERASAGAGKPSTQQKSSARSKDSFLRRFVSDPKARKPPVVSELKRESSKDEGLEKSETQAISADPMTTNAATESKATSITDTDEVDTYIKLPFKLEKLQKLPTCYKAGSIPTALIYEGWVSETEEKAMLQMALACPASKWTQLKRRALQNWGGQPRPDGMISEPLPRWMLAIIDRLCDCQVFEHSKPPNHVLLNKYAPGEGIMPHKDGPLYVPRVAILSLGGNCQLEFRKQISEQPSFSLYLRRRSLLIFTEQLYTEYFHGISEITEDTITDKVVNASQAEVKQGQTIQRDTRISLTIRIVPGAKLAPSLNTSSKTGSNNASDIGSKASTEQAELEKGLKNNAGDTADPMMSASLQPISTPATQQPK